MLVMLAGDEELSAERLAFSRYCTGSSAVKKDPEIPAHVRGRRSGLRLTKKYKSQALRYVVLGQTEHQPRLCQGNK